MTCVLQARDDCLSSRRMFLACGLLLSLTVWPASAETSTFTELQVPQALVALSWHKFHVYSKRGFAQASGSDMYEVRDSHVTMHAVARCTAAAGGKECAALEAMSPMALSIMHFNDFITHFDRQTFCKLRFSGAAPFAGAELEVFSASIPFKDDGTAVARAVLNKTGTYVLLLSNCGTYHDAQITGSVSVQNPYGFLPPHFYHRIVPLCLFLFGYALLSGVCVAYGLAHQSQLQHVHYYFAVALLLSMAEASAHLLALERWNSTDEPEPWTSLAMVAGVMKWVYMYAVAAYVAVGSSQGGEEAMSDLIRKRRGLFLVLATLYTGCMALRECVGELEGDFSPALLLKSNAPVIIMDAALLLFCVVSTKAVHEDLDRRNEASDAAIMVRLHYLSEVCSVLAWLAMVANVGDMLGWYKLSWNLHWMAQGGAGHLIGTTALVCAMINLRPGQVEKRNLYGKVAAIEVGEKIGCAQDDEVGILSPHRLHSPPRSPLSPLSPLRPGSPTSPLSPNSMRSRRRV